MAKVNLYKSNNLKDIIIPLTGSKSESNRALIINALCNTRGKIENLAFARDTEIMQELLQGEHELYDARDAGTVMRFMTAYLSVMNRKVLLTGSDHMKKRPIKILVEALQKIGVDIEYKENSGYPPLSINGLNEQKKDIVEIDSHVSSQYISALLMIAPVLPMGLTLKLKGEQVSLPYIDMTVFIMQHYGVDVDVNEQVYSVAPKPYTATTFIVESDWSAASYWYSIFVLSEMRELRLKGLKQDSLQGDSVIARLMERFGVITNFNEQGAVLTKQFTNLPDEIDFIKCPDLAQTFAVLCAVVGHSCSFYGLQTLKIKETDRIGALKVELRKIGADFIEHDARWEVVPAEKGALDEIDTIEISTYDDHRMAMAFAPLATIMNLQIDDSEVVNKSYPSFWKDMEQIGFNIEIK
jgi:3-phosphoshikimate 1-carboxyvinyltransferase